MFKLTETFFTLLQIIFYSLLPFYFLSLYFKIKMENNNNNWECLSSVPLSVDNVIENQNGTYQYSKILRVTKHTCEEIVKIFVDIRNYNKGEFATRHGICMFPIEFRWIGNRIFKNKIGVKQLGGRTITITKSSKDAVNIKVKTAHKESDIWLNQKELILLKENYHSIMNFIKEQKLLIKYDEIDFQNLVLDNVSKNIESNSTQV